MAVVAPAVRPAAHSSHAPAVARRQSRGAERVGQPRPGRTPAGPSSLDAALARVVRGRSPAAVLQRAIIAVDGKGEGKPGNKLGQATRNCLWNLRYRKSGKGHALGDARGKVVGPAELGAIAMPRDLLSGSTETIYILGHGDPLLTTIAGMTPELLAAQLQAWIEPLLTADFTGAIKLVTCVSATEETPWTKDYSIPAQKSLAERLAIALAPASGAKFRPTRVQGIVGVGWVDELSGKITSVDINAYKAASSMWKVDPFQELADPSQRYNMVHAWFGALTLPCHVPGARDKLYAGKGPRAKRNFQVGSGKEIAPPKYIDLSSYPHGAADWIVK